jgi:hypothetical protein
MTLETLILHGGSFIEWRSASGFTGKSPLRIDPHNLRLNFTDPSTRLQTLHKAGGTLLWRSPRSASVVKGPASANDLIPPLASVLPVSAQVLDVSGCYLPRTFNLTLAEGAEQTVDLFASPLGTRYGPGGGIFGRVAFRNGVTASWSLLQLAVTPSLGSPLNFIAQADQSGEFCLALDRLPALTKDAPAPTYSAKLTIKASAQAHTMRSADLQTLSNVNIATGKAANGASVFATTLSLAISPGKVSRVTSPRHDLIVLKSV